MKDTYQVVTMPKKEIIKRKQVFEGITFWAIPTKGGKPIEILIIPFLFDEVNGKPFDPSKIEYGGIYEMTLKKEKTPCIARQFHVVTEITFTL